MRFLKKKIKRAHELTQKNYSTISTIDCITPIFPDEPSLCHTSLVEVFTQVSPHFKSLIVLDKVSQPKPRDRRISSRNYSKPAAPTKNIVINYGKAISSFATSRLAGPYLQSISWDGNSGPSRSLLVLCMRQKKVLEALLDLGRCC